CSQPVMHSRALHDALPICERVAHPALAATGSAVRAGGGAVAGAAVRRRERHLAGIRREVFDDVLVDLLVQLLLELLAEASLELRSEEHTSELQSRFDLVCR